MQSNSNKRASLSSIETQLVLTSIVILIASRLVEMSPPVDFLSYTSQGTQERSQSILTSQNSIYHLENDKTGIGERILRLIQNTSHSHDNGLIDLETTRYAWQLMERQALQYTKNKVNSIKPIVKEFLTESKVSDDCKVAIDEWLTHLSSLNYWALLMWNSWGELPPAGLYQGSYTDLGSYQGCLSIEDNPKIGRAQYCTLDFQPIIPTRPRFHSIFKRILSIDPLSGTMDGGDFSNLNVTSRYTAHQSSASMSYPTIRNHTISKDHTQLSKILDEDPSISHPVIETEALIEFARNVQYFYYVRFRLGSCLPSKCSIEDVQKLAQTAGQKAVLQAQPVNCKMKDSIHLNKYQKVAIWILTILALIAILGTVVDILNLSDNSLLFWLLPWSLLTNFKKLFNFESIENHGNLGCIHGMKFFSMLWVIYGHTILYTDYQSYTHFYRMIETQIPSLLLLPSLNANFSVETFFVISGFLTAYITWKHTNGDPTRFNKLGYITSRYIRLTPQLVIVILCYFLLPLFGDGPIYKELSESKAKDCYNNWPINLLHLQSYINDGTFCIYPSWWLSIEMTFQLMSVFVLSILLKSPTKGILTGLIIATVLTLWGSIIHYSNGFAIQYLPSIPQRYEVVTEQTRLYFHKPYPHAASYFFGIVLGYIIANRKIKKLSLLQLQLGWLACLVGFIVTLWGSYFWNLGYTYTQLQATVYFNLCQVLWPISISWIILACSLGYGGPIHSILNTKFFVFMGRITYMTYLSHTLIIYHHYASTNVPLELTFMLFVYTFIGNTFFSLILGLILTLVYEAPISSLQKKILSSAYNKFYSTGRNEPQESSKVCTGNGPGITTMKLLPNINSEAT